jgi:hypothetical protein
MGEVNKQVSALAEEKSKLETKVSSLEQEISVLKTTQPSLPDGAVSNTAQTEEIHKQNEIIVRLLILHIIRYPDHFAGVLAI